MKKLLIISLLMLTSCLGNSEFGQEYKNCAVEIGRGKYIGKCVDQHGKNYIVNCYDGSACEMSPSQRKSVETFDQNKCGLSAFGENNPVFDIQESISKAEKCRQ